MGEFGKTLITIVTAIIGVAIISVIVSQRANTAGVIQSASSGFAKILNAALAPIVR